MMSPHIQAALAAEHQADLLRTAEQHRLARQASRSPGLLRLTRRWTRTTLRAPDTRRPRWRWARLDVSGGP